MSKSIDRQNLEELVRICLTDENPPISIGKGKELLGFKTMNEMREWLNPTMESGLDECYAKNHK
jgi:hypothetical protein